MSAIKLRVQTNQEAFDAVVRHLATMTGPSLKQNGDCAYLGQKGAHCAISHLLDCDDAKRRNLDRRSDSSVWGLCGSGEIDPGVVDVPLLERLQARHDGEEWVNGRFTGWDSLRHIANAFGLSVAVIDELEARS